MPLLLMPRPRDLTAIGRQLTRRIGGAPQDADQGDPPGGDLRAGDEPAGHQQVGHPRIRVPRFTADELRQGAAVALLRRESAATVSPAASVFWAWLWVVLLGLAGSAVVAAMVVGDEGTGARIDSSQVVPLLWRAAHQIPIATTTGNVSLLPLGLTLAVVACLAHASRWVWLSLRHLGAPMATAGVGGLSAAYLLVTMVLATAAPHPNAVSAAGDELLLLPMAGVVGIGVALGIALATGLRRGRLAGFLAAGLAVVLAWVAAAGTLVAVSLIRGFDEMVAMTGQLLSDQSTESIVPATMLGLVQLAYLPNVLVWAVTYLTGAGMVFGTDTVLSASEVTIGAVPDLPMLSALPSEPFPFPRLLLGAAVGLSVIGGVVLGRRGLADQRLSSRVPAALLVTAVVVVTVGLLASAASGSLGVGRLELVGAPVVRAMAYAGAVSGTGLALWALGPTLASDIRPHIQAIRRRVASTRGRRR